MSASDIVKAYEAGLITEQEAAEQGMVDRLSELYADAFRYARHQASAAHRITQRLPR